MERFIFLDFDGVVCTNKTYKAWRKAGSPKTLDGYKMLFDTDILAMINDLCQKTGAKLIASTWWRRSDVCLVPLRELVPHVGFTAELVGETPFLGADAYRGHEISKYIQDQGLSLEQFIVLDDDAHAGAALPSMKKHGGRWIQTAGATGLTKKQIQRALVMLGS